MTQMAVRNRSVNIINSLPNYSTPKCEFNTHLNGLVSITRDFLQYNDNFIVTRADKGNITVALDKDVYFSRIEKLLKDNNTYPVVKKDPTKKLTLCLRDLLKRWKDPEFISASNYRHL